MPDRLDPAHIKFARFICNTALWNNQILERRMIEMSNRPITSREYKLILKTDRFKNRTKGADGLMALVAMIIKNQGGKTKIKFEKKFVLVFKIGLFI